MPLKTHQDEMPTLNLTPMIDVVFLLTVFFMVAAKFTDVDRDIDLRLPEVASSQPLAAAPKARQVAVHADGRLTLDRQEVSLEQLTVQLKDAGAERGGPSVVILGDAGCEFQHIAAAMAACKDAGVTELAVSVRVAQAAGARQ